MEEQKKARERERGRENKEQLNGRKKNMNHLSERAKHARMIMTVSGFTC